MVVVLVVVAGVSNAPPTDAVCRLKLFAGAVRCECDGELDKCCGTIADGYKNTGGEMRGYLDVRTGEDGECIVDDVNGSGEDAENSCLFSSVCDIGTETCVVCK